MRADDLDVVVRRLVRLGVDHPPIQLVCAGVPPEGQRSSTGETDASPVREPLRYWLLLQSADDISRKPVQARGVDPRRNQPEPEDGSSADMDTARGYV